MNIRFFLLFFLYICRGSFVLAHDLRNGVNLVYLGVDIEDQKFLDHAPMSVYLNPQAFASGDSEIKTVELRVCVDWKEASQALLTPQRNEKYEKKYDLAPYNGLHREAQSYVKMATQGFCRKFETVTIPTSAMVLASIKSNMALSEKSMFESLKVTDMDKDLERRIKGLTVQESLLSMRQEMEMDIKNSIMKSKFIDDLRQEIYQDVLNEIKTQLNSGELGEIN